MPLHFKTAIPVRYAETDQMGVVHHAAFPIYFEQARTEQLAALGMPYTALESEGIFMPVTELHLQYLLPARYGDTLGVHSAIHPPIGARLRVDYRLIGGCRLLVRGYTVLAFLDRAGRPIRPPARLQKILAP